MSAKTATSCVKPSWEGLDNRIIPGLLPRFGAPGLTANCVAGVHVGQLGRRVVLSNLIQSAAGGAGSGKDQAQSNGHPQTRLDIILRKSGGVPSLAPFLETGRAANFGNALPLPLKAGGHGHSNSPIAFDGIVQGDPAPTKSVGEPLIAGNHDLVTTGANGSLCAVAMPNNAWPGCPPGRQR
jgi:hypothetical protein